MVAFITSPIDTLLQPATRARAPSRTCTAVPTLPCKPNSRCDLRETKLAPNTRWDSRSRDPIGYLLNEELYSAYGVLSSMDPMGLTFIQDMNENVLGFWIFMQYITAFNHHWNIAARIIPDDWEYHWSTSPNSQIIFNNDRIRQELEGLKSSVNACQNGVGTATGVRTKILLDVPPMTLLEYFLGETSVHYRVNISKPWFYSGKCCNPLYVKWNFWIDDPIDANAFWELKANKKGFVDGVHVTDIINILEGVSDIVNDRIRQGWVPFKVQTTEGYYVCCD